MNFLNFSNKRFSGDTMGFKNLLTIFFIAVFLIIGADISCSEETAVYPEIQSVTLDMAGSAPQDFMPPGRYIITRVNQDGDKIEFFHNVGVQEPDFNLVQPENYTQIGQEINSASTISISGDSLVVTSTTNYQQAVVGQKTEHLC